MANVLRSPGDIHQRPQTAHPEPSKGLPVNEDKKRDTASIHCGEEMFKHAGVKHVQAQGRNSD